MSQAARMESRVLKEYFFEKIKIMPVTQMLNRHLGNNEGTCKMLQLVQMRAKHTHIKATKYTEMN